MSDNIIVEEKPVEPSHSIAEGFNLPPTPPTDNKTMTYEQLEHLKTLIKCAKRMNKGDLKNVFLMVFEDYFLKEKEGRKKQLLLTPIYGRHF